MEHCGAVLSSQFKKIYMEEMQLDIILEASAEEDKFWYVLHKDDTLAGCIGSKEYRQICETGKLSIKKDFLRINAGEDEKQTASEIFTKNSNIRKLPVVDENGKLLYEYVRSVEAYFEELNIGCGINNKDMGESRQEKIVVSLTSYGKRLDKVHLVIKSIMSQSLKADAIVLYIAEEDSTKEIGQEKLLVKAGLQIVRNTKDLKPHKKYFYSMQEYSDSIIVTVDDDTIYDEKLLADLYAKHLEFPKAVICRRGHRIGKWDGRVAPYDLWDGCVKSKRPEKGICATGIGGILYPCGEYRKWFLDEKGILETSLCGDDLWLMAVELLHGISVYAIGEVPARVIDGSQKDALYIENADRKRNDEYLNSIQQYFGVNLADLF